MKEELIKENVLHRPPLPAWSLAGAAALSALAMAAVALVHTALPPPLPRDAPPDLFNGAIAHEYLVNLTSIGPRVAGSYENEVLAVNLLVAAVRDIARAASPHHRVELDVHTADGAFPLTFLDGMNNVYRGVQSVVVRVSPAGAGPGPGVGPGAGAGRDALLFNCHFDTVPDSPGASDDAAGCAVLLGTLRALTAARRPLRHPVLFLLNGAEENIMQGSHAFITTHKWARSARAFVNIEACGAGGREVLFQAGPRARWLLAAYARVPRPFASSVAQELFQSGLIPADTDFRIFRDFGKLSGVDLAWSSNGYVYHTRLDDATRVPPDALQRTGDNVLALAHDILSSEYLARAAERWSERGSEPSEGWEEAEGSAPVFFDVLGVGVVSVSGPWALGAVALGLALALLNVHLAAGDARKHPAGDARGGRAAGAVAGGLRAAGAADVLPGAGLARHVRAGHGPRRHRPAAARRADIAARVGADAGGVRVDAALPRRHQEPPEADLLRAGRVPGDGGGGRGLGGAGGPAGRLQRRAAAPPHAVPRAAHAARARARGRRRRDLLLDAGPGRQLGPRARRTRAGAERGGRRAARGRGGVRAARVLRRAVLPARAAPRAAQPPRARAGAARAPARARGLARAGAGHAARARAGVGLRARGAGVRAGRGRAPGLEQRAAGPAARRRLGRLAGPARHLLLRAARRAPAAPLAARAAPGARVRGPAGALDGPVGGGPRAVRRRQAAPGARAAAGLGARLGGADRLGRRPAPLHRLSRPAPAPASPSGRLDFSSVAVSPIKINVISYYLGVVRRAAPRPTSTLDLVPAVSLQSSVTLRCQYFSMTSRLASPRL